MVTEEYLNGTYYKYHQAEGNKHLLFLLPGQSLSPRAFWEFKLPEGKTHVDYFLEAGIDVILFDPVGYGRSMHFRNYDRVEYAKQITDVTKELTKQYDKKVLFGFSTSTAPSLIAAQNGYFNKVIIHSPLVRERDTFLPHYNPRQSYFEMDFNRLISERIEKISDALIPKSNKIDGWIDRVKEISGDIWIVPYQTMNDIHSYWTKHKTHSLPFDHIVDTLSIIGEYDNEMHMSPKCNERFKNFYPHAREVVIPNSTHFSMWENNAHITRNEMIKFIGE